MGGVLAAAPPSVMVASRSEEVSGLRFRPGDREVESGVCGEEGELCLGLAMAGKSCKPAALV